MSDSFIPEDLLLSFDPAIDLHSTASNSQSIQAYSEDLEAFAEHLEDVRQEKNRQGIVIQHRAWRLIEAFRSEGDPARSSPSERVAKRQRLDLLPAREILDSLVDQGLPSSPPELEMPYLSSPVQYPQTSSPAPVEISKKRRRNDSVSRSPLKKISSNARLGGFLLDDSDDDEITPRPVGEEVAKDLECRSAVPPRPRSATNDESPAIQDGVHVASQKFPSPSRRFEPSALARTLDIDLPPSQGPVALCIRTNTGRSIAVGRRRPNATIPYEQLIASRSDATAGHARKSYYGIDIHALMDEEAAKETEAIAQAPLVAEAQPSVEAPESQQSNPARTLLWTEKYRAHKFTDLVGDERTHRSVLRWLKAWDPIVFPGMARIKRKASKDGSQYHDDFQHRKILLMTGPPGLGKTTLAHVCARQAGYEVQEINASDERSGNVVRGRVRDMVGTENVKGVETSRADGKSRRKAGKPVCVVIDEVDGVVGGSGSGGEGGFVKALIDLVQLDQRNSAFKPANNGSTGKQKKKGDKFQILRPLILICNDVYHPALRPLRQSGLAEIIHMRKPPLNMVISRIHSIFEREGVPSDTDAIRRLCEATWGISTRKGASAANGTADGDIRSVLVLGEWIATKIKVMTSTSLMACQRLTRPWVEQHILGDLSPGGGAARALGRGGARDVVDRVFQMGAGFPALTAAALKKQTINAEAQGVIGVAEAEKRLAMERLREMAISSGDTDRIMTDCFTSFPTQPIQDDTFLSKPCSAYDWLHFHDLLNSHVMSGQEWELAPYLSSPVLAFHHLFASSMSTRAAWDATASNSKYSNSKYSKGKDGDSTEDSTPQHPFTGSAAPFAAIELTKANTSTIQSLQSGLSLPLARIYRSATEISTELLPYTLRMLAPDVKPVVINTNSSSSSTSQNGKFNSFATASVRKASEKALVERSINCMAATGVRFERTRVENLDAKSAAMASRITTGFIYRMEPPLDTLAVFETYEAKMPAKLKHSTSGFGAESQTAAPAASTAVRYAVRQVLEQEWKREALRIEEEARQRRMKGLLPGDIDEDALNPSAQQQPQIHPSLLESQKSSLQSLTRAAAVPAGNPRRAPKKDFFGRVIVRQESSVISLESQGSMVPEEEEKEEKKVWVTFREGYSNAVRKPMTLDEFMRGL